MDTVEAFHIFDDALGEGKLVVTRHKEKDTEGYVFSIIHKNGFKSEPICVTREDFEAFIFPFDGNTRYHS